MDVLLQWLVKVWNRMMKKLWNYSVSIHISICFIEFLCIIILIHVTIDKGCNAGLLPACYFQAMLLHTGLTPPGSVFDAPMLETMFSDDSSNRSKATATTASKAAASKVAATVPSEKAIKTAQQLAEEKVSYILLYTDLYCMYYCYIIAYYCI